MMRILAIAASLCSTAALATDYQRLEGHGGPVHALTVGSVNDALISGSFDNSVTIWLGDQIHGVASDHDAAVKAVHFTDSGYVLAGGDDTTIRVRAIALDYHSAQSMPLVDVAKLTGHTASISAISSAQLDDHAIRVATAGWDKRIGLWRLDDPKPRELGELNATHLQWLTGHRGPVQAVTFSDDGETLYSASVDGTIRSWSALDGELIRIEAEHGFGVNTLALNDEAGWLAYGALDGAVRILDVDSGEEIADITSGRQPVLALAQSRDGTKIAIGDGEGHIHIVSTDGWSTIRDFRATPRGPVWALAFTLDGTGIYAGTLSNHIDLWPIEAKGVAESNAPFREFHRDPEKMSNGERQFYRKCSICHTLTGGTDRRAGPTLSEIFGRRAGSLEDYIYSDALSGSDLVWGADSLDKLFDIGPDFYTPGSKMPMQRIVRSEDRADLIEFLRHATALDTDGETTK